MKVNDCLIAWYGHKGDPGTRGRGMTTTRSRNWIVLLHLTVGSTPQVNSLKSENWNCLLGSNVLLDRGSKCDFRNSP